MSAGSDGDRQPPPPGPPPPPPRRSSGAAGREPSDDGGGGTGRAPGSRTSVAFFAVAVIAILATGAVVYLLLADRGSEGSEVVLQPSASAGDDPFTDSVASRKVEQLTSGGGDIAGDPVSGVNGGGRSVESIEGSAPGLYGGTEQEDACDGGALVDFLAVNPAKARAWAVAQGIAVDEISDYVASLTPVILREDTRVTNNGFLDGEATPFQAVLQSGSAVLVDDRGVPRVRCACGNPLSEPDATDSEPEYSGRSWSRFDRNRLVAVAPAPAATTSFRLVDVETGREFERATGTQSLIFAAGRTLQRTPANGDRARPQPFVDGAFAGELMAISTANGITAAAVFDLESNETKIQRYSAGGGLVDLATVPSAISDVLVVGDRVLWTGDRGLSSIGVDGGDLRKVDIALPQEDGGGVAEGLAFDGTYVYFSRCQDGTIGRVRPDGTDLDAAFISVLDGCPQGLDTGGGYLYWTELGLGSYDPPRIGRASTGGGDVQSYWLLTDDVLGPYDVAVSDDYVFWSHGVSNGAGGYDYVGRANIDGSDPIPHFVTGGASPRNHIASAIAVTAPPPAVKGAEPMIIDETGVGDLRLGMPLSRGVKSDLIAETHSGCELGLTVPIDAPLAAPLQGGASFFAPEGEAKLTYVAATAGVATAEGITIGSTADEVIAAYPGARLDPGGAPGDIFDVSRVTLGGPRNPRMTFLLNHPGGVVTTIAVPAQAICD